MMGDKRLTRGSLALDFTPQSRLFYIIKVIRVLLLAVFGLLIPGGIIGGLAQNESSVNLGLALIKAACCVAVVILALLLGFQAYFWTFYKDLCSDSIIVKSPLMFQDFSNSPTDSEAVTRCCPIPCRASRFQLSRRV